MKQEERLNSLDQKVSALQSEVRFQDTLMARTESIISDLSELSHDIKTRQAAQDERIAIMVESLKHNHEDIEALRRENIAQFTLIQQQVQSLDKWKWIIIGAIGALRERTISYITSDAQNAAIQKRINSKLEAISI